MPKTTEISPERIHIIFKTHLDVGFTDFSRNVVQNYFSSYIPRAIRLARELRESGRPERFIWTTGSWLIYEYLQQSGASERLEMERAITAGDITWHALPFTTHSENMDASLFRFGLSLSQELDQRFGKHTIAAKMTDVPGHTRAIVPLLAEAGVQFLHIGVNGASTPPDVPPVFVWKDPSGAEVMVMYHKGSYGDIMIIPGLKDAIYFAHTGDNLGPQGVDELAQTYKDLHTRFPQAQLMASTLDAFATRLAALRDHLPIVDQEIGDTWIHGLGTDPTKESRYRALLRLRQKWLGSGVPQEKLAAFSRRLLLIPEHTWGLDLKTHLGDWEHYSNKEFEAVRGGENYHKMESSWQEQRDYLTQAVESLEDPHLRRQAQERLRATSPILPNQARFVSIDPLTAPIESDHFTFSFHPQSGTLTSLVQKNDGCEWSGADHPLGAFWHQTFSVSDYERYYRQYVKNKRTTRAWSVPDFTKPGLGNAGPTGETFFPTLTWAGRRLSDEGPHFLLQYSMPEVSWQNYGGPKLVTLELHFPKSEPAVVFDLQWFHKTTSRLPEAFWFSFTPANLDSRGWQLEKLGEWISPYDVIRDGNRHLHAIGLGAAYKDSKKSILLETLDSALLAPGQPSLLNFTNLQPNLTRGLHFNLYNNLWGTNFPMWFGEDARFRFAFRISPQAGRCAGQYSSYFEE